MPSDHALRVLVIGAGTRGGEHLAALAGVGGLTVVGVVDPDPAAREGAATAGYVAYSDLDAALALATPDYAVIAAPVAHRLAPVERLCAVKGLRAITVEKPMASSLAEARRMLAVCEAAGVLLLVSHQLRYDPAFNDLAAALADGELGALRLIDASSYGNLANQGPHLLDAIRWLGGREAEWVSVHGCDDPRALAPVSTGGRGYWRDPAHPGPMWATAVISLAGGLRATLQCGLLYQAVEPDDGPWLQKRLLVTGDAGIGEARVAGWSRIAATDMAAARHRDYTADDYRDATRRFHEALLPALAGGEPHRCMGADAIRSLELQLACERAMANAVPVALPLAEADGSGGARSSGGGQKVSVIIALPDHRGYAERCLRSWTSGQSAPADAFEVILVTDGRDAALDERLRPLLRPGDRLLTHRHDCEMALYHHGAAAAAGSILFFTEPHCIAEPDCLAELAEYLSDHEVDGCCIRSTPICPNRLAEMESRMYNESFIAWSRPESWSKVIIRGFAIRRIAYEDAGGFALSYDRFSEWLLAAQLHRWGRRLGYAAGSCVAHCYTDALRSLVPFIRSFTEGECRYRRDADPALVERYFGAPPEWGRDNLLDSRVTGHLADLLRGRAWLFLRYARGVRERTAALRGWWRFRLLSWAGPAYLVNGARWATWRAALRTHGWRWFSKERCYRAYVDFYLACTREARVAFMARNPVPVQALEPTGEHAVAGLPDAVLVGFHGPERVGGLRFRWTGVVGGIRLAPPAGDLSVMIEGGMRDFTACGTAVWFNRHLLGPNELEILPTQLRVRLPRSIFDGAGGWLVLHCVPMSGGAETRELGLALTTVRFAAVA